VTALLIEYMAPIMFAALVVVLLLGYPVAFSLGAVGLIFGLIGIELHLFAPDFLQALPDRVYGVMNNDTLLAIPFSLSWDWCSRDRAWPRIFSTRSAICSARFAADLPTR
jgi:hypothetical protein